MDLLFKSKRHLVRFLCFWAWLYFVLLGSSLTDSQLTLTWDEQPSSQTVKKGATVTFRCAATVNRKIEYYWSHNNETIQTNSKFTIKSADGTLEITDTQLEDRGTYQCYVTRAGRTKILGKSNTATLDVKGVCNTAQIIVKSGASLFLTGSDIQIRCKCYMNPSGTYTFSKDSAPLNSGGHITVDRNKVFIKNATTEDSGSYTCTASSHDSAVTKTPDSPLSISVIVGQHPQFLQPPPATSWVIEGNSAKIPCKAIGNPTPIINWYADGDVNPLQNSSKYSIKANGSLEIKNADSQDAIMYKCTATNLVNKIAKDTKLELAYLDDVTLPTSTLYILRNDKTEVLCEKPKGSPVPSINWLKGGQALPSKKFRKQGCCTLEKNKTKLTDTGNFTCVAKNGYVTKSKTIQIVVSEQPQITQKPDDQRLKEDKKAVLNCTVKSVPAAKISWRKDGKEVQEDSEHIFEEVDGGLGKRLVIPKVKPSDNGTYECLADHPGGWADQAQAILVVKGKVKLKGIPFMSVYANLHKSQTIECDFEGYPPINVTWKKKSGIQIEDNQRINQSNNVLTFTGVEKEDAGTYWCTGKNTFSSFTSYVNITVFVYPRFLTRPKNTTAYVKDHIWLHCNASGDPKPKISWSKDVEGGDKLDPNRFIQHPNGTLHIKEVHMSDGGRYYCIAANHAEMKQSKFSLVVQDRGTDVGTVYEKNNPGKGKSSSVESMGRTIGIAVGCAAAYIVLVVGLMIYCKGRRARQSKKEEIMSPECENLNNGDIEHQGGDPNDMTMNPVYKSQPSYDKMEFPRHDLEALRSLGNGSYGRSFLARASGIRDGEKETMVVVKALASSDDQVREEFTKEMDALCGLQHDSVVALLGMCREEEPIYMIFESAEKGDLKQFLLSCYDNGRSTLNSSQKLSICEQLASGMNYLSSQEFVHKDLAARNCMVGKDLKVKIAFLSLSYDLYNAEYFRFNNVLIPLRWMPPEAIFDDDFTEKSDVWSYGVLVWEIYTFGQMPYHDRSSEEVLKCIKNDLRLNKPDNCPDTVLEVMEKCWEGNPLARPTFQEVLDDVSGISVDSHV